MRLTCPNCGAQYEVPDEVIPTDGRDVQCSNCGNTWFQDHPDNPVSDQSDYATDEDFGDDLSDNPDIPVPEVAAQTPDPDPVQQTIDPAVSDILRQEAEHETRLRAAESGAIESQPDLGLDDLPDDEAARRAREARERMARMRGEDPEEIDISTDADSRRGLLPDIEEINSTLRASGDSVAALGPVAAEQPAQKSGGFSRGFGLVALIAVTLVLIYMNATKISLAVPLIEPILTAYVAMVDQVRVWLEVKVSGFMPK